jgi:hypothetical protein
MNTVIIIMAITENIITTTISSCTQSSQCLAQPQNHTSVYASFNQPRPVPGAPYLVPGASYSVRGGYLLFGVWIVSVGR